MKRSYVRSWTVSLLYLSNYQVYISIFIYSFIFINIVINPIIFSLFFCFFFFFFLQLLILLPTNTQSINQSINLDTLSGQCCEYPMQCRSIRRIHIERTLYGVYSGALRRCNQLTQLYQRYASPSNTSSNHEGNSQTYFSC